MPILDMETQAVGGYSFSGVRIDQLGSTEYTLVSLAADASGSVWVFAAEINRCIRDTVDACRRSPRADNLLLRLVTFTQRLDEVHGFKPLAECHLDAYDHVVDPGGSTALYDAAQDAATAIGTYGKQLTDADFSVNAILVVITDGEDNASVATPLSLSTAMQDAVAGEKIESLVSILVGVNLADARMADYLSNLAKVAKFTQFIDVGKADAKSLAKLAAFVSKSISSQSQSLGSGGASKPLVF